MKNLGTLYVTIDCDQCGITDGVPVSENTNRCVECGRYASDEADICCAKHEVRESPYPSGGCPYCEQEQHRRDMIEHEMTRDPQVEPW